MKTRKKLNLRFVLCVLAVFAVLGVGVHFYCYDVSRPEQPPRPIPMSFPARVPMHFEP